jgi:hypothetical protein
MAEDFNHLVARLEQLLPAGVQARVEVGGPDALLVEGWFSRVRLSIPTPHGDPALVLDDATRVELPRAQFVAGEDLGPDESGSVRLHAEFRGVVLDLGVRPLGV